MKNWFLCALNSQRGSKVLQIVHCLLTVPTLLHVLSAHAHNYNSVKVVCGLCDTASWPDTAVALQVACGVYALESSSLGSIFCDVFFWLKEGCVL